MTILDTVLLWSALGALATLLYVCYVARKDYLEEKEASKEMLPGICCKYELLCRDQHEISGEPFNPHDCPRCLWSEPECSVFCE